MDNREKRKRVSPGSGSGMAEHTQNERFEKERLEHVVRNPDNNRKRNGAGFSY